MNLNKENLTDKSERAAVKSLLELSQKENFCENYAMESGFDVWINKKQPLRPKNSNISKPLQQRPLTAQGKPPRANKISAKVPAEKSNPIQAEPQTLSLPIVSPVPPCSHTPLMHFIRPPMLNALKVRSKSLKEEDKRRRSIDHLHASKETNLNFRKKMIKYKLLSNNCLLQTYRTEGLKLITMPRPL